MPLNRYYANPAGTVPAAVVSTPTRRRPRTGRVIVVRAPRAPRWEVRWDPAGGRVTLAGANLPTAARLVVERYDTATLTRPVTVRGSTSVVPGPNLALSDREFTPGVVNTYRLRMFDASDVEVLRLDAAVTPTPTATWLRSPTRPFLDRVVTVVGVTDVDTPARGAVFEIAGRRLPIAITEIRGSRRFDVQLLAADSDEAAALTLFLSFGDVVLLQPPGGGLVPGPLYASVGDVTTARRGAHDSPRRYITLPLTECDAPDPSIAGNTVTWAGVKAAYPTWAALIAARASWRALLESVSDPADEVVG